MPRRVDVDDALPPVTVPGPILNELYGHALETLPEECCGLILGRGPETYAHVVRCRNVMTQRHLKNPARYPLRGTDAFWMNEADYQRADEQARAAGEQVTAVYHSHVGGAAYLSQMDLLYAEQPGFPFPGAAQIVVAVAGPQERRVTDVALFRREGPGQPFQGHRVESSTP